jgi:hypothetical protein
MNSRPPSSQTFRSFTYHKNIQQQVEQEEQQQESEEWFFTFVSPIGLSVSGRNSPLQSRISLDRKSIHNRYSSLPARPKTAPKPSISRAWDTTNKSIDMSNNNTIVEHRQEETEDDGEFEGFNFQSITHPDIPESPPDSPIVSDRRQQSEQKQKQSNGRRWVSIKSDTCHTVLFPLNTVDDTVTSVSEDVKIILYSSNHQKQRMIQNHNIQLIVEKTTKKDKMLYYKLSESAVEFNCVKSAFRKAGFKRTSKSNFNALWTKQIPLEEYSQLNQYQKINHFPGSQQLGRKDCLHKNISRMRRLYGNDFSFLPKCWMWPEEKKELQYEMDKNKIDNNKSQRFTDHLYIIKPRASSRGRGIHVVSDLSNIKLDNCIVQKYIHNPMLIDGKKFDIRLYVVVTSFDPLRIYLFEEGLVRFATEK